MRRDAKKPPRRSGRKRGGGGKRSRRQLAELHRLGVEGSKGVRSFLRNAEAVRAAVNRD